jgi:hypothetical protein
MWGFSDLTEDGGQTIGNDQAAVGAVLELEQGGLGGAADERGRPAIGQSPAAHPKQGKTRTDARQMETGAAARQAHLFPP